MIADLHCHYPMHLVHEELEPDGDLWHWLLEKAEQEAFDLVAEKVNDPGWCEPWRVSYEGLLEGRVGTVCSVLYWPVSEIIEHHGQHPGKHSFERLTKQLDDVEADLAGRPDHVIVTRLADLDETKMKIVHCVEGGFHLGPDEDAVAGHVAELARRGVFYITLAHLFFRGVAENAPALPMLSDEQYDDLFRQPDAPGLPPLGRRAVEAMVEHHVVVDLSHMRQNAIDETLELLDDRDPQGDLPVIASHVGVRKVGPDSLQYNLSPETMQSICDRKGVIGVILAQHLLGKTADADASRAVVGAHIRAIHDAVGSHDHTAIGTDLDGFINPVLAGLDYASQLPTLEDWIREDFPDDAEAILHGNADRVLRRTYELRE